MKSIKEMGSNLMHTPIGTIGGGVAAYFAAKKFGKVENKWMLIGIAVVGAIAGSIIEYKVRAKSVKPTITPATK